MNTRLAISEVSADTLALEHELLTVEVGDTVVYKQLSAVIGRNTQGNARGVLTSARRRVLRDHGALFESVIGTGLKRLDDVGKVQAAAAVLPKMRRLAKRGRQKAASVDNFEALPNELKVSHNVTMAMLGAIDYAARPSTTKKLEACIGTSGALPTVAMLDAIKGTL